MATRSEPARNLDAILLDLKPFLKEREFRVRARAFNRTTIDGLTQVVQFQMGSFQPPGTQEIPGLRPNLYGRFTVNLGVYVPESQATGQDRIWPGDNTPAPRPRFCPFPK